MSSARIVTYTAAELRRQLDAHGSRTDWARVDALSEAELEALVAAEEREGSGVPERPRVTLDLPDALARHLPESGPDRDRAVSRIVRDYLKRRIARLARAQGGH